MAEIFVNDRRKFPCWRKLVTPPVTQFLLFSDVHEALFRGGFLPLGAVWAASEAGSGGKFSVFSSGDPDYG